jgi:hypothetical protein
MAREIIGWNYLCAEWSFDRRILAALPSRENTRVTRRL